MVAFIVSCFIPMFSIVLVLLLGACFKSYYMKSEPWDNSEVYQQEIIAVKQEKVLEKNEVIIEKKDSAAQKACISLIFIDNYYDVLDAMDDTLKSLVVALIDRKINEFAQSFEGVIRKFEKDRYIFVFDYDKLDSMIEGKFSILDEVKSINMENKVPFTLSIGIGIDGISLMQNMEFARAAIDLSLGRGGDQALIKSKDDYKFFGGKQREAETNSTVRSRVKAYALAELINEAKDVIIMGHKSADLDCLGAGIGVAKIVEAYGKNPKVVLNNVSSSIKSLYDKLIALPEYRGNFFLTGEEAINFIDDKTLLIVVDAHRPSILEEPELLRMSTKTVVIDHHRKSADFIQNPVLTYHEPYASSTCELITEMIRYMDQKVELSNLEADALLAGITVDTKNYLIKTGARTFETSAFLRRRGADTIRVRLLMQSDMSIYKAKTLAVNEAKIIHSNIAIAVCPEGAENPELASAQISDDLLNIAGIEAAFTVYFDKIEEKVKVSARSLGNVNVQVIMEKLGGGGHQNAAGAQIPSDNLEVAMEKLLNAIEGHIEQ